MRPFDAGVFERTRRRDDKFLAAFMLRTCRTFSIDSPPRKVEKASALQARVSPRVSLAPRIIGFSSRHVKLYVSPDRPFHDKGGVFASQPASNLQRAITYVSAIAFSTWPYVIQAV